jgi:hypothetical protein
VHTQGRFVDYAKKLIEIATEIGTYISTLTDYDSVGIQIIEAANSREGMNIPSSLPNYYYKATR